jgi:hypothetical protein
LRCVAKDIHILTLLLHACQMLLLLPLLFLVLLLLLSLPKAITCMET